MSDWKERSIKRRDERQTKVPNIRPPSGSSKNTKKWCRGKVGVPHKPKCVSYHEWENRGEPQGWSKDWKVLVCEACGKELDTWWPYPTEWKFTRSRSKPDWVTDPQGEKSE